MPNKIYMERQAHRKMMMYTRCAKGEITGLGTIKEDHGSLFVEKIWIDKQVATGSHVVMDAKTLSKWMVDAIEDGRGEEVSGARFWWHSHVNFSAFKSATDENTCQKLLSVMPYLVCAVVNKKGDLDLSIYLSDPCNLVFNNLEIILYDEDERDLRDSCYEDIKELVSEPLPPPSVTKTISYFDRKKPEKTEELALLEDDWEKEKKATEHEKDLQGSMSGITEEEMDEWRQGLENPTT